MNKAEYERALVAVASEMTSLLAERNQLSAEICRLDERLGQLKMTHEALTKLLGDSADVQKAWDQMMVTLMGSEVGISNAIRQILATSEVTLSPTEIKAALVNRGFDLSGYANAGAVVHNTLLRLEKQGEIMKINDAYMLTPKRRTTLGQKIAEGGWVANSSRSLAEKIREIKEKK